MRPGVTARLGVDFEAVRKRNPRIVYGSISGFGQYGPYSERPSIDQIAQGMSGIMSVTGIPGQGPLRVGVAVTDIMAGAFLAQGILIALLDREVSGEGRWVQTSLIEAGSLCSTSRPPAGPWTRGCRRRKATTTPPTRRWDSTPPPTAFLNLAATSSKNFQKLCRLIGRDKAADDPRFGLGRVARKEQGGAQRADRNCAARKNHPRMVCAAGRRRSALRNRSTTSGKPSPTRRSRHCGSSDRSGIRASAKSIWWRSPARSPVSTARCAPQRQSSASTTKRFCDRWDTDRTRSKS